MDRRLSLYLDLLRFLAAMMVVVAHVGWLVFPPLRPFTAGREAVIVFFVLSGFVIGHVTSAKERTLGSYASARFARMATVVPLAILVTITADAIGQHFSAGWYAKHLHSFTPQWGVSELARYLTFTNEVWLTHVVVGSNEPYWSLGFEVPYYLLFGTVFFARTTPGKLLAAAMWSIVFGPKIALFFPLWASGFLAHRVIRSGWKMQPVVSAAVAIGAAVAGVGLAYTGLLPGKSVYHWSSSATELKLAAYTYALGALLVVHLLAVNGLPAKAQIGDRLGGPIRFAAGGSFSLYIMHQPIIACLAATIGDRLPQRALAIVVFTLTIAACYLLAEAGERRKREFSRVIARMGGTGDRRFA